MSYEDTQERRSISEMRFCTSLIYLQCLLQFEIRLLLRIGHNPVLIALLVVQGNRSAKLKQCKLDARREQWLSQGSQGIFT